MSTTLSPIAECLDPFPDDASDDLLVGAPEVWQQAACLESDPALFFSDDMQVVALAKQVCTSCPVREQCLAAALRRREPHGVWGGELFQAGVVIERKRPRGRPRKNPLVLAA